MSEKIDKLENDCDLVIQRITKKGNIEFLSGRNLLNQLIEKVNKIDAMKGRLDHYKEKLDQVYECIGRAATEQDLQDLKDSLKTYFTKTQDGNEN